MMPIARFPLLNAACVASIVACAIGAGAIGEERRAAEPTFDGTRYQPVEAGRELRYRVTVSPPLGKPRQATATTKTDSPSTVNGKTYYKFTTSISGLPFVPDTVIYYRSATEGVYRVMEGDEESPESLYLPAKIKLGDRWGAKKPSGEYAFKAVAVEDVETPSGKYARCLRLSQTMKMKFTTNTQELWLAPGVGVVKQVDSNSIFSSTSLLDEIKEPPK